MTSLTPLLRALPTLLSELAGDALSPPSCAACDERLPRRAIFCAACASSVLDDTEGDGTSIAAGLYGGALGTAIRRLKYGSRPDLGRPLGHLALRAARQAGLTVDLVVPVPLHPDRLVERGYNQASLIAAVVSRGLGVPMAARALHRVHATAPQALLGRQARLDNLAGAFAAREASRLRGRRVLVVDDVATTGATLGACREAMMCAGAASVIGLVLARAERMDAEASGGDAGRLLAS
ncbi:MAG: ComF family protein [Byssovorax sp.]